MLEVYYYERVSSALKQAISAPNFGATTSEHFYVYCCPQVVQHTRLVGWVPQDAFA